jgi:hypothetical protein
MDKSKRDLMKGALVMALTTATPESLIAAIRKAGGSVKIPLADGSVLEVTESKVFHLKGSARTLGNGRFQVKGGGMILLQNGEISAVKGMDARDGAWFIEESGPDWVESRKENASVKIRKQRPASARKAYKVKLSTGKTILHSPAAMK